MKNQSQVVFRCIRGSMRRLSRFVIASVFLSAIASASSKTLPLEVKVLNADSYTFEAPPAAPLDCNLPDFSAYCHSSKPVVYVENTMVVQEPDGKSLKVACTVYNRWSQCADLPVNQTYPAKIEGHNLEIQYLNRHHKMHKERFEILTGKESSR